MQGLVIFAQIKVTHKTQMHVSFAQPCSYIIKERHKSDFQCVCVENSPV